MAELCFRYAIASRFRRSAVEIDRGSASLLQFSRIDEHTVFVLLDNRHFSFADLCKLRDDYPALCAGGRPCPKLRKRDPRSQKPIRPMRGICRLRLGRKNASSRLRRERHTTARLNAGHYPSPF